MTSVILSFQPGEETEEQLQRTQPETYDPGILEETFFFMPVQLTIDGVHILALRNDPDNHLILPLLGFCASLNRAVDRIKPGVEVDGYMAGGGWLMFLENGGSVRVHCTLNDRIAYATRQELVAAAREFRMRVRDWLLKAVPALQSHPYWKEWFPGHIAFAQ